MNAPMLWILLPGLVAVALLVLRQWERLVSYLGTWLALVLAALAWWLPLNEPIFVGSLTIRLADTLTILGRRFVIGAEDRPVLVILYLAAALWFGGSYVAGAGTLFVPLSLGVVALLTAAIAVDPFLYAALLIEMAVLLAVPLLEPPGKGISRGVLRYLTINTLGMPFILFTGWMLAGVEASPTGQDLVTRASILLGLGFAFLMAVFPFHSWIPMLAQEAHPYSVTFVLVMLPGAISFFGLGFLDRYAWLRSSQEVFLILRSVGVLMVVIAGFWAAFQRHLGRMLGYAVIFEIGLSLLNIGLVEGTRASDFVGIYFASLLPRGLALGVWALALAVIRPQVTSLYYRDVQGVARRAPIVAGSLVLAHFSLVGLPLLAGFPARLALFENAAQVSPLTAFWALFGSAGLLVGGLRTLTVLVMGREEHPWRVSENLSQQVYLVLGSLFLIAVGLFPHWFLPIFAGMPQAFENLVP